MSLTTTLLSGEDLSEIFVPYDDDGFYGGSIIILFLIYVSIIFTKFIIIFTQFIIYVSIIFTTGGLIAYFIFPKSVEEFRSLIELYYEGKLVEGVKRHLWHLLLFTTFMLIFIGILKMFHLSYFYLFMTAIFSYSSFFGFYTLLYTLMALYYKNIQKVVLGLLLGAFIGIGFLGSGYAIFQPLYEKIYENKI